MPSNQKVTVGLVIVIALIVLALVGRVTFLAPLFPTPTPTPTRTPVPTATNTPTPTPTHTPTPTPTNTPTPTRTPTPTFTPMPTFTPTPPPIATSATTPTTKWSGVEATPITDCASVTRSPHSTIRGRRFVSFYGTTGPGLGILGRHSISDTLKMLDDQVQPYRELDPCVEIVPAFEIVTTIADLSPGEDGDYSHRAPAEGVSHWINGIVAVGGVAILDLQPGQADLNAELDHIEPWLRQANVHLAVDPEWTMSGGGVPGVNRGWIDGETINQVQAWLSVIAEQTGEHKMLVIHQFQDENLLNKEVIQDYPLVDLVWSADGYGGPGAKVADYHQQRGEGGFEYGGFKLFFDGWDDPLMTPGQVMALDPPPAYISYQ